MMNLISEYKNYMETLGKSKNTIKNYMSSLGTFEKYFEGKSINEVKLADIRGYIKYLKDEKKLANKSINRNIATLSGFYTWLYDDEIIKSNPMLKIKSLSVQKNEEVVYMNIDQSKEFLNTVKKDNHKMRMVDFAKARDEFMFRIYLECGLRATELIQITLDDVDVEEKSFRIVGKGNKIRFVSMSSGVENLYYNYMSERAKINIKDEDYLFLSTKGRVMGYNTVRELTRQYAESSNLDRDLAKKITPHKLRHSTASTLYAAGVDVMTISKSLGHANVNITQSIYIHLNNNKIMDTTRKINEELYQ